jgi:hypothetical protein
VSVVKSRTEIEKKWVLTKTVSPKRKEVTAGGDCSVFLASIKRMASCMAGDE